MRKLLVTLVSTGMLLGLAVLPVSGASAGEPAKVGVMKHLCPESIQSEADFMELEAKAATNELTPMGIPTLGSTAETVLACPVIVLTGDTQTPDAIGAGEADFEFTIEDSEGTTQTLTTDTTFSGENGFDTPVEDFACETDIEYDADRSGTLDEDVCLDFSAYTFADVVEGPITVNETTAPEGTRFGTVRLTPPELSDDAAIGLEFSADGEMTFDSSADGDEMVMLHVYNFVGDAEMPDAAMEVPTPNTSLPLLLVAFGTLAAAAAAAVAVRTRS
ncbi:MAG: hypothetical protein ACR2I5_08815 [Candidatus Limnocylindria bacterium]